MRTYTVADTETLRNLCIKNNWFTNGTNEQYDKLFEANTDGEDIENIASMIWICTDAEDTEIRDLRAIREELVEAQRQYEEWHKYEIIWDEEDEYGTRHTYGDTFIGNWVDLQEKIKNLKRCGCYNIDATYTGRE